MSWRKWEQKDLRDDTELAAVPLERVGKLLESVVIACGVMLILFGMDDTEEDLFEVAESETIEDDTESVAKKILEADLWEEVEDDDDEWTWDEPEETLRLIADGVEVYWMKDYWWIKSDSRKILSVKIEFSINKSKNNKGQVWCFDTKTYHRRRMQVRSIQHSR